MSVSSGTALSIVISAIAIALLGVARQYPENRRRIEWVAFGLGSLLFISSSVAFIEAISAQDFGINFVLWKTSADFPGLTFPGPIAPNSSICFVLISLAIVLVSSRSSYFKTISQYLSLLVSLAGLTALIGFICGADYLCTMFGCMRMAPTTSIAITGLGLASFLVDPAEGPASLFVSNGLAGRAARGVSVLLLSIPILIFLRKLGEQSGLYDTAFGWTLFGLVMLGLIVFLVVSNARTIQNVDFARLDAEQRFNETARQMLNYKEEQRLQDLQIEEWRREREEAAKNNNPKLGGPTRAVRVKNVCLTCDKQFPDEIKTCPDDFSDLVQLADESIEGTVFCDKYLVVRKIGQGGMSHIYQVTHLGDGKTYAVKLLKNHLAVEANNVKRFQLEAKTAMKLVHPNLLRIHDYGVSRTGEPYLLMDYIEGYSLCEILDEELPPDLDRFCNLFEQVAEGVAFAHDNGVVHRDLKPGNIMIVRNDDDKEIVKLVDFGLAKVMDATVSQKITQTGEIFGSPLYMSPEQCLGQTISATSDIYSLGCVMFEYFTNEGPFAGDTVFNTMHRHITMEAPDLPVELNLPKELENMIKKCLAKKAEDRYASVRDIIPVLTSLRNPSSV